MKSYLPIYVLIILAGCEVTELQDPTIVVESKNVIHLVLVDENFAELNQKQPILADSGSTCFLKAVLESKGDGSKEIVFSTTGGVLTNVGESPTPDSKSTLTVTPADREVVIQLNALDIVSNDVVVSASTGKVSDVIKLAFTTSYPYDFQVNPVNTSVLKTEEVEISVEAVVKNACMSEGQYLEISAVAHEGVILNYPQFVKITNQKAKFKIVNKSQTTGHVTIALELATAADKIQRKEVVIIYN